MSVVLLSAILSSGINNVKYVSADEPPSFRTVKAEVTAYTASVDETDSSPSITANGERTRLGGVACPLTVPFGTKVEIEGHFYHCNDRMNSRYKSNFDILVSNKEVAMQFGRKTITIKIYE